MYRSGPGIVPTPLLLQSCLAGRSRRRQHLAGVQQAMEVVMRNLTMHETALVAGGADIKVSACPGGASVEVKNVSAKSLGKSVVEAYEGAVSAASHIIGRVADALK